MTAKIIAAGVAGLLISTAALPAVAAMSEAECMKTFATADTNKDGVLNETEGARYHAALRVGNKMLTDGRLDQTVFLEQCKADAFVMPTTEPGAPMKGANSFTEAQAKDRALAYGYTDVSGLRQDGDGIWIGMAKRDGADVKIAIDFKGNVVTQ